MSKQSLFHLFICLQFVFLCSYAQLTFPSSSIQIPDSGITLYFEYNTTNQTIFMGLDMAKNVDYYAIGFANKGNYAMHIFDIVAFIFDPTNASNVTVLDMYTSQSGMPPTDVSLGGTSDYYLVDSYVVPGTSQVLFERKLNTGDPYDYIFDPNVTASTIVMSWAFNNVGERGLTFHLQNAGTVSSPMYNGFNGVARSYFLGFISPELAFIIHGYVLLFGWGILIEIALEFGRYRKFSNFYLKVHLYTTSLLYVLTALTSALAIYIKWGDTITDTLPLSHFYMGLINLGLCTFQTFFGFLFNFKILKPVTTKLLPYLSMSHIANGILIYLICKTLITTGVYMHWPEWMTYMYIYNGVIFGYRILREILHRMYKNIDGKSALMIKGKDSQLEEHQLLMDLLNKNTPVSEILQSKEVLGLKWAILDNKVFDLKNITHPGGNFILEEINGREVGRFIYGSFGLESLAQSTQYLHSKAAIGLIKNNFIGTIMNTQHLLVPKVVSGLETFNVEQTSEKVLEKISPRPTLTEKVLDKLSPKPSLTTRKLNPAFATNVSEGAGPEMAHENRGNGEWVLEKKTELTPLIAKFEFISDQYAINPLAKDIRHLGRHMKVSHKSLKKVRLYTLVLSQTESRIRRRQLLWDKNYKDPNTIVNSPSDSRSESLPLILKKYNNPNEKTLSSFLHEAQELTEGFIVEGPFGTGLDLTSDSTGVHCIFAAGTGILPFLDLFDFLLEGVLDPSSGNNVFKNGFKLHLFASFAELKDFVGLDICEKLAQACKDKGMADAFKMVIRANDAKANELYTVNKEMFDNAFVQKHADKECTRAYVCGPPGFNLQIPNGLNLIGIPKTKIIMV